MKKQQIFDTTTKMSAPHPSFKTSTHQRCLTAVGAASLAWVTSALGSQSACSLMVGSPVINEAALPSLVSVLGEESRIVRSKQDEATIENLNWLLKWNQSGEYDKYGRSAILVQDVKNVTIRNIAIDMADADYRTSHGVFVERCDRLTLDNVRIRGAVDGYGIRAEDCKEVYLRDVEISGLPYQNGAIKPRAGGGIEIAYGRTDPELSLEQRYVRIDNCYIHDYHEADAVRNQDGINVESALDVVISNCLVKNWGYDGTQYAPSDKAIDTAIDISFRRTEDPVGKVVVEKSVLVNAYRIKTPGEQSGSQTIFRNNLFVGTGGGFYHNNILELQRNVWLTDGNAGNIPLRLWNVKADAQIRLQENLFAGTKVLNAMLYANSEGVPDKADKVVAEGNYYALPISETGRWLDFSSKPDLSFNEWIATPNVKDTPDTNVGAQSCMAEYALRPLTQAVCEDLLQGRHFSACQIGPIGAAPELRLVR